MIVNHKLTQEKPSHINITMLTILAAMMRLLHLITLMITQRDSIINQQLQLLMTHQMVNIRQLNQPHITTAHQKLILMKLSQLLTLIYAMLPKFLQDMFMTMFMEHSLNKLTMPLLMMTTQESSLKQQLFHTTIAQHRHTQQISITFILRLNVFLLIFLQATFTTQ